MTETCRASSFVELFPRPHLKFDNLIFRFSCFLYMPLHVDAFSYFVLVLLVFASSVCRRGLILLLAVKVDLYIKYTELFFKFGEKNKAAYQNLTEFSLVSFFSQPPYWKSCREIHFYGSGVISTVYVTHRFFAKHKSAHTKHLTHGDETLTSEDMLLNSLSLKTMGRSHCPGDSRHTAKRSRKGGCQLISLMVVAFHRD